MIDDKVIDLFERVATISASAGQEVMLEARDWESKTLGTMINSLDRSLVLTINPKIEDSEDEEDEEDEEAD